MEGTGLIGRVLSGLKAFLAPSTFKSTRNGTIAGLLALFSIILPWVSFQETQGPEVGAANLFSVAGGLGVTGGPGSSPVVASAWAVIWVALIGGLLCFVHRVGAFVLLTAVVGHCFTVMPGLVGATTFGGDRYAFGFSAGFALAVLVGSAGVVGTFAPAARRWGATVVGRDEQEGPSNRLAFRLTAVLLGVGAVVLAWEAFALAGPASEFLVLSKSVGGGLGGAAAGLALAGCLAFAGALVALLLAIGLVAGAVPPTRAAGAGLPSAMERVAPREGPPRDILAVRGLTVRFYTYDGVLKALDGVTFNVREREILGIVGETGCGKSVTAKAILRLIPDPPGRITGGEVVFDGINLLDSIEEEARIKVNARGRAKIRRKRKIAKRMEALMRTIRGNEISMIFQEPTAALNPVITIEEQIGETFLTHQIGEICQAVAATRELSALQRRFFAQLERREWMAKELEGHYRLLSVKRALAKAAREAGDAPDATQLAAEVGDLERGALAKTLKLRWLERRIALSRRLPFLGKNHLMGPIREEVHRRVVEILKQVNIADPEKKAQSYPFELSGGMQQRATIAMALACRPRLLLADEPTTALDVTIQAQILSLIRNLRDQFGSSIMLITHDLGVVAETCERVGVMYAGVMAEIGAASDIFNRPQHPYTVGLLRSIPETYARTGKLSIIPGSVPSLLTPPAGCRFHPRCPLASDGCKKQIPVLSQTSEGHLVACHLYDHPEFFPAEAIARRDAGLSVVWEKVVAP